MSVTKQSVQNIVQTPTICYSFTDHKLILGSIGSGKTTLLNTIFTISNKIYTNK